jgi:hypothetical protein
VNLNSHEAAEPPKTGALPGSRCKQAQLQVRDCHRLWPSPKAYAGRERQRHPDNQQECGFAEYRVTASLTGKVEEDCAVRLPKTCASMTPEAKTEGRWKQRRSTAPATCEPRYRAGSEGRRAGGRVSSRKSMPCACSACLRAGHALVNLLALMRQHPKTAKVGGSSGGVPPLLRALARPPGRVQSQARRRSTAAACGSARSSRFGGRRQGRWRVEPLRTWLHCCLTPRSRGDPARRGALGPRRAVAGSIVLRGPKAPRLSGRLSSNVRPQNTRLCRSHAPNPCPSVAAQVAADPSPLRAGSPSVPRGRQARCRR